MNKLHLTIVFILISLATFAQKKGMNYQAVIIDPKAIDIPGVAITGQPLVNSDVCIKFGILKGSTIEFEEVQKTKTDDFGLVNLTIGSGTKTSLVTKYNTFESIVWDATIKSLQVSVSFDNCATFQQVSIQAFNYTPYAFYAGSVDYKNVNDAPKDLSYFGNDVGYLVDKDLDPLRKNIGQNTTDIANLKQETTDKFSVINQSIVDLEKRVTTNEIDIAAIKIKNTAQDDSLALINNKLAIHDSKITTLEKSSTTLNTKIDSVNTNLTSKIAGNTSQITAINQTLANQQNQITQNNTTLNNKTDNLQYQIWGLGNTYEVLSNKSTATDLGNANPSNTLYPSQKAVKTYVDVTIQDAIATGAPDATTLAKGKVQLAGDLAGTADLPRVPALANKEELANKTTDITGNAGSQTKYPTVKAIKDYVDASVTGLAFQANLDLKANINSPVFTGTPEFPSTTKAVTQSLNDNSTAIATTEFVQSALAAGVVDANASTKGKIRLAGDLAGDAQNPTVPGLLLKEDLSNKSNDAALGTSTSKYPTQAAVKTYVDNQFANAAIPDATTTTKGKIQLGGDLNGVGTTAAAPVISDNAITTNKINDGAVTNAKIANGAINNAKIGETISVANGGTGATTSTGALTNLGAEPTANKSNDVNLGTSSTLFPTQNAVKNYVDTQFANAAIPDATTTSKGKIQLGGDLNGVGTTAAAPVISDAVITTNKLANAAVTTAKIEDAAVTNAKIVDGAVNTNKLSTGAVTSIKIGNGEVKTINLEDLSVSSTKLAAASVETAKIANLAVTDAKINSVSGSKVTGSIPGNAQNVNGVVDVANGGTGNAATLTGYIKGNGASPMTSSPTIPVADIVDGQSISNLSTATDLGNTSSSDVLYPSQLAVKTYVDAHTNSAVGTSTQTALNLKEDVANKDSNVNLGTSNTAYPTQNAVKAYVDTKFGGTNAINSLTGLPNIADQKVLGNMSGGITTPQELPTTGTGNVVLGTSPNISTPTLTSPVLNGTISGSAVMPIANGGTGATTLSSGYVKGGASSLSTVSNIPWQDVTGAVHTVNGNTPDPTTGNVAIAFGMVTTGLLANRPAVAGTNNGDIYVVSGETGATASDNGRTFISTGGASGTWNEVTPNQASLDARYVQLAGSTMAGNLIFPTGTKATMADAPVNNTDLVNKDYVDARVSAATPDATALATGKIQLAGDLTGSATNPLVNNKAITFPKMQDVSTNVVLGRSSTGSGSIEALTTLPVATLPALTGDVTTVSGTVATTITDHAVTYNKIQNLSAQSLLLGTGSNGGTSLTEISLGTGLTMNNGVLNSTIGTVTNVSGTANRVVVSNVTTTPTVDIASNYVGQSSITTLGTVTAGTWNASTIGVAHGGTGVTTLAAGYVKADGTNPLTTTATIPVADVVDAETINNKSTATDLGGSTPTDIKYPTQLAVKTYVDATVSGATPEATSSVLGKVKLGGDLAGSGTTASAPIITSGAVNTDKLADNSVTTAKIIDGSVETADVADLGITTAKIAASAVTSAKIADGTIVVGDIADDAIETIKIKNYAVITDKIANQAVTPAKIEKGANSTVLVTDATGAVAWLDKNSFGAVADMTSIEGAGTTASPFKVKDLGIVTAKIADAAVTTIKIADANVTTAKIADANVTTAKIADLNVTNAKLAADAITTDKIKDGEVQTADVKDANVTTAKIADLNVTNGKIAEAAVTTNKIAAGTSNTVLVTDATGAVAWLDKNSFGAVADMTSIEGAGTTASPFKVKDLGIVTAKIADAAVTTAKIADANVTTAKIADANVTTGKIADLNVTNAKLAADAITTDKIKDGEVQTVDIKDANVTTAKIAAGANNTVLVTDGTGVVAWLNKDDFGGVTDLTTIEGAGTTASPYIVKDLGIVTAKIADAAVTTSKIADANVTTAKIADANVTTGKIADLNVTNAKLEADAITTDKIKDGEVQTADIKDANITTGKIADSNVTTAKIADANVTTSKIAAGANNTVLVTDATGMVAWLNKDDFGGVTDLTSIEGAGTTASPYKVKDLGIVTAKIADAAVTTAKIADANVTTAKIADANVTTAKIADLNVTNAKLEADAITTDKIKDGEVQTADIKDANITTGKIADSNVTTAKIADANVTTSK
ncbi:beta strand repeat-containing protein, partial [Aquirufa sp. ROCK-SH2]